MKLESVVVEPQVGEVFRIDLRKAHSGSLARLRETSSEWMTVDEAARYLRVKRRTLLLWVRQGKVKGHALSGTKRRVWRFLKSDLDAAVLSRPVESATKEK